MQLAKEQICQLVPHSGAMCLIDGVVSWDENSIECTSFSHQLPDNPLRNQEGLPVVSAIEFGAQGMAVHGGLLAKDHKLSSATAYLASVKDVQIVSDAPLDSYPDELTIRAEMIFSDQGNQVYDFAVSSNGKQIMSGQAMVIKVEGDA